MTERIAVIGAGIIGALSAREIAASHPTAELFLIDRDMVGLGASQRSAGVHFPLGKTPRTRSMAAFSENYYQDLAAAAPSLLFHALDLYAVVSEHALDAFRDTLASPCDAALMPPNRSGLLPWPAGFATMSIPRCHYAEVGALARFVARELRGRLTLLEGVPVETIAERRDGLDLTLGTDDTLLVDKVVLAPGPWVHAFGWRDLLEPLALRVKKIVAFHLDDPIAEQPAAALFPEQDAFIIPMPDRGHWLYSYTCPEWDVAPDCVNDGITARNVREGRAVLQRYAAAEPVPVIRSGRVFCDAYSSTREPVVATVGSSGRVIFAGAAGGSGYRLAPGIANEVAQLLN